MNMKGIFSKPIDHSFSSLSQMNDLFCLYLFSQRFVHYFFAGLLLLRARRVTFIIYVPLIDEIALQNSYRHFN
jgi:hypothetical protein